MKSLKTRNLGVPQNQPFLSSEQQVCESIAAVFDLY